MRPILMIKVPASGVATAMAEREGEVWRECPVDPPNRNITGSTGSRGSGLLTPAGFAQLAQLVQLEKSGQLTPAETALLARLTPLQLAQLAALTPSQLAQLTGLTPAALAQLIQLTQSQLTQSRLNALSQLGTELGTGFGGGLGGVSGEFLASGSPGTVASSELQGMASAINAAGNYNLATSNAALNIAQAEKQELQNTYGYLNGYFDLRATNRVARAAERGPNLTSEQLNRIAQENAPKPLTTQQVDPVSGKIFWPDLLQGDQFQTQRDYVANGIRGPS